MRPQRAPSPATPRSKSRLRRWGAPSEETVSEPAPTTSVPATAAPEPIPVLKEADTLTGLDGWLNTSATSLEAIRADNQITVVQFWTFGCRNCKNTLEALGRLYDDFGDRGVEIVGVHSPEFSYEADVDNIIEAAAELNVTWPIALDTNKRNFHRWQEGAIAYWPRVYVIDSDNQIRFDRTGDGRATYEQLLRHGRAALGRCLSALEPSGGPPMRSSTPRSSSSWPMSERAGAVGRGAVAVAGAGGRSGVQGAVRGSG